MTRYALRGTAVTLIVVASLIAGSTAHASPEPQFNPPKSYYLALGDSYAYGLQPAKWLAGLPPSAFNTGYVDGFAAKLRLIRPGITTVNYSCPGESTVSFLGGRCGWRAAGFALHDDYAGGQADAAVAFLRAHPGKVSPITLTLWGNDLGEFTASCDGNFACIQAGAPAAIAQFSANLSTTLERLRSAAPDAEIIVTGPFSYFLGAFPLADPLIMALNEAMAGAARTGRAQYADIFATFNPQGDLAAETARICALTLLCTERDVHLSDAGYQAMADIVFDASDYVRLGAGGTA
jgi:lysophospholipase L1-like esterase